MRNLSLAFEFIPIAATDYSALEVMDKRDLDELEEGLRLEHLGEDGSVWPRAVLARRGLEDMWNNLFSRRRREKPGGQ